MRKVNFIIINAYHSGNQFVWTIFRLAYQLHEDWIAFLSLCDSAWYARKKKLMKFAFQMSLQCAFQGMFEYFAPNKLLYRDLVIKCHLYIMYIPRNDVLNNLKIAQTTKRSRSEVVCCGIVELFASKWLLCLLKLTRLFENCRPKSKSIGSWSFHPVVFRKICITDKKDEARRFHALKLMHFPLENH